MKNLLTLVPEKYHDLLNNNVWKEQLQHKVEILSEYYTITEVVPACLEELITLKAGDLFIDDIVGYNNESGIFSIESLLFYIRSLPSHFYCINTICQGIIIGNLFSKTEKGFGRTLIKGEEEDFIFSNFVKRLSKNDTIKYKCDWVFKVKSKDLKKIVIDKPTMKLFQNLLTEKEFENMKENFKRINSYGEFIDKKESTF